jgi:transposase-like protein/AcrR family transcriptional regulator
LYCILVLYCYNAAMNPKAFPELLGRIHELSPRQREQLRSALATPVAAAPPAAEAGPDTCPHCGAQGPRRYGHVRGQQRWRCQACRRTFGLNAGTPLLGLHRKAAWKTFAEAMNEGLSARGAAERCGIHRDTASRWRRRALAAPAEAPPPAATARQRPPARGLAVDPRTRRTREALRRALLSLMGRKQFADVTVRDIAAEAGIGYATFFRHHASKVELLNEVAAEQIGRLGAMALNQVEGADPRLACLLLCRYIAMQRPLWYALLTGGAAGTLRRELVRLATAHGRVRSSEWLPVELGANHGVAAAIEILAWWLRHPGAQTAEQVADVLDRLVLQPLMAGSSPRANAG